MKGPVHFILAAVMMLCACEKPAPPVSDLAPDGVYFLKVAAQGRLGDKVVEKRPGTLLNHYEEDTYYSTDGVMLQLAPQYVTNDMKVVKLIEIEERSRVVAVATPRPTPTPIPPATPPWENPLGKGAYSRDRVRSPSYVTPVPYYR
ncbi:MAG: hypothetical protein QOE70_2253 [Chthoniobacter sp.]|jgi:hypothetical protein|nr:hypothetical protein [Chthoniobacter sp.]